MPQCHALAVSVNMSGWKSYFKVFVNNCWLQSLLVMFLVAAYYM